MARSAVLAKQRPREGPCPGPSNGRYAVAFAADLYAVAWQQPAGAPPSETREQRAQLKDLKEILGSRRWQEEERRPAPAVPLKSVTSQPRTVAAAPRVRPDVPRASERVIRSSRRKTSPSTAPRRSSAPSKAPVPASAPTPIPAPDLSPVAASVVRARPLRREELALLDSGKLWEIATELRPLLEQTARAASTTT
ncbi:hypothetical protein [Streptomyces sp. NBC_01244]|uniref:hypothetical protein n=1 Tax=Streptomyces sp. NBC_01244 TaxID=2903797 RepID=UPI002E0FCD80|nr:hypothetical protein OG247_41930 [Streptomyces sp. NBC_01244]